MSLNAINGKSPNDQKILNEELVSGIVDVARRNPQHAAVAATEGILQILDDEELEGVVAHELSHVKHRDILISSVAATLAAAISPPSLP